MWALLSPTATTVADPTYALDVCRGRIAMQHYMLLQRNLVYTGITRAKRLLVVVGQRKALGLAVRNDQSRKRYSGLLSSLREPGL
ncbi:MAG: ATP-binding domain-containing protein [Terracidiphilus sp.]